MKQRVPAVVTGLAMAAVLLFVPVATVTAASSAGPSGKGVCAAQAAASAKSGSVASLQAFGDCEIGRRFTTLDDLSSRISGSKVLTSSDASALASEVASTKSGLEGLKSKIDSETDVTALRADIVKIATDYRVYLLVVPQVGLVSASDAVFAAQSKFSQVNTALAARIATDKAAGKDTSGAQSDLDAMNAAVTAAVSLATPLPAALLALTPAQYDNGTIASARTALGQARTDLASALADAKACRDALQALG